MTENERLAKLEQWKHDHIIATDRRFHHLVNQNSDILVIMRENQNRLLKLETDILMYTRIVLWTGVTIGAIGGFVLRYWGDIHGWLHKVFP